MTADGRALIYFESDAPKSNGWLISDDKELVPLRLAGDELPGLAGVKLSKAAVVDYLAAACGVQERCPMTVPTRVSAGETIAVLEVAGAPYKRGLFRMTPSTTELLLSEGQALPSDRMRSYGPPASGVMFETRFSDAVSQSLKDPKVALRVAPPLFLRAGTNSAELSRPPHLVLDDGGRVSLADVVAFRAPDEAVVVRSDGVSLLKRLP